MGIREPAYFFATILVPAIVFWFFGVPEVNSSYIGNFLCCSFSAYSFYGVFFFQYSISQSQEKESQWSQYLHTLPTSTPVVMMARFITSSLLGLFSCILIYIVAQSFTSSDMSFGLFMKMQGLLILASPAFLLMGLFLGNIFKPNAMVPIASFFHLTLSFVGGLWKPPEILPEVVQKISYWLPTYHYGMLVWPLVMPDTEIQMKNVYYLVLFSLALIVLLFIQKTYKRGAL